MKKYYVYTYEWSAGGGRRYILASSEAESLKRLKQYLNEYFPFRKFTIHLDHIEPA